MGVDYSASFGVGFEIKAFPEGIDNERDYLDDLLTGTKYQYIEWGEASYSGKDAHFAVVLDDKELPRHNDVNGFIALMGKLQSLRRFLMDNGFEISDEWLVGGLHLW